MAGRKICWGVLGAARIAARRVLPALARSETGTAHAIAGRDRTRAQEVAGRFQIPRVHETYDALLNDSDVDAVYIPLPNSLHRPWSLRAAAAGKHILCEKPLADTADEAREMVDACRHAKVLLQEAFMYRFHPQIQTMRRLIEKGTIGQPSLVRATFTFTVTRSDDIRLNPDLGGGGLLDVGCYCVNISRLLLGEPVTAYASAVFAGGVDVRLAGLLAFSTGAMAQIDCGLRAPYRQICEIVGPEGTITLARPFQPEEDPALIVVRRGDEEERIEVPATNQYTLMLDHMGACLLDGLPPQFPADDAVRNMQVLDAVRLSAQTGQPVSIGP